MKLLTIVGARPQFVKAAPLSAQLRKRHQEILVHTGQHYDANMSDIFFDEMGIPKPNEFLGVGSGSHGEQTGRMLIEIEKVLTAEQPEVVIVFGDTNSTVAGALAAAKLHIPVAHVEAGLRSFNREMPEEINRVMADHLSTWLFPPSQQAVEYLRREGIERGVINVGDIMADSVRIFREVASERSQILPTLGVARGEYYLATIHRPANTDVPDHLENIISTLQSLPLPVIFPCHPRTAAACDRFGIALPKVDPSAKSPQAQGSLLAIPPVGYLDMLQLEQHAKAVITDSGGIQKEAFFVGTPCVTVRTETEWPETIEVGWNRLCAASSEAILAAVEAARECPTARPLVYGDGHAAERIVDALTSE